MDSPQLCQIYIDTNNTPLGSLPPRKFYSCNLNGRYEAKLAGITWADSTNVKDNRLIRIKSDSFRMMYGSFSQTLVFCNRTEHNFGNPRGEFPIMLECVGNNIDLSLESDTAYDGTANNYFDFCILSFIVKKLE